MPNLQSHRTATRRAFRLAGPQNAREERRRRSSTRASLTGLSASEISQLCRSIGSRELFPVSVWIERPQLNLHRPRTPSRLFQRRQSTLEQEGYGANAHQNQEKSHRTHAGLNHLRLHFTASAVKEGLGVHKEVVKEGLPHSTLPIYEELNSDAGSLKRLHAALLLFARWRLRVCASWALEQGEVNCLATRHKWHLQCSAKKMGTSRNANGIVQAYSPGSNRYPTQGSVTM